MNIQNELLTWAQEVVDYYNPLARISADEAYDFYTQSDLSKIDGRPDILILGINPGSTGPWQVDPITYKGKSREAFLAGNAAFPNRKKWHFWNRLVSIFTEGGIVNMLSKHKKITWYIFKLRQT